MKNKPLALFTGAALATLAALAGLKTTDWPASSTTGPKTDETGAGTQPGTSEASKSAEKPDAGKALEKPAEIAAILAPEPPKAETEVKPELDTVRVESDGQAIVAGRAKPGAEVALKLGNQVIGKGIANSDGSWVVVPDNPLPKGAHEIIIEQKAGDSAPVTAEQSIAVAVPDKPGQQAMVALTEPGTATKVLQAGGNQERASLSEPAAQPAPEQPKSPETAEKQAEPAQTAAQTPKADEPAATAQKPAESTEPAGETQPPAAQGTTVAKTEEQQLPEAVKPPEPAPATPEPKETAENVPLRLDAVDYNDKGDIIFSGRATPGTAVRLYVDNRPVGDAIVDSQGNWSFAGKDIIRPGTHDLRADQIDTKGKVIARIELPFLRENAEAVAALNTPPATEKTETQQPQPQASETQPAVEQPQAKAEQQPTGEQPQATAEQQPTGEQPQATAEQQPTEPPPQTTAQQPSETTPEQQPEVSAPQPSTTAETQPPKATDVAKAEPEASDPAAAQPAAEDKKEDVTTTAAVAAEQAAKAVDPDKPRSGKVVIQPGNNLWKLSRVIYGRGINYTVIYQANKEQIRNPARIYPGQIFAIPNASPPEMIDPKRKDPLTSAEGGAQQ